MVPGRRQRCDRLVGMRADIIDIADLTARQRGAWRELAARACVPNPFGEVDYVENALRGLRERHVGVLVVSDERRWHAAMPVRRVTRWRHVPGPLLVSWRHQYCFLTTPLVDRDDPEAALASLLARGAGERGVLGLMLNWVDADGPLGAVLASASPLARRALEVERFSRASLQRRPENDYVSSMLSVKHRRELRRLRRRLEEEVGPVGLHDRAGDDAAVQRFLRLEQSGWKGRSATAMTSRPRHARFFTDLCRRYADEGRLQLLTLESAERTIAMKCNVRAGDGVYCLKITYDEHFAPFSPGVHLEMANVDHFHEIASIRWMDSCAMPDNAMINRLWPDRRELRTALICPGGLGGGLGSALWRAARSVQSVKRR